MQQQKDRLLGTPFCPDDKENADIHAVRLMGAPVLNEEKSRRFISDSRAKDTTDILIMQRFDVSCLKQYRLLNFRVHHTFWLDQAPLFA